MIRTTFSCLCAWALASLVSAQDVPTIGLRGGLANGLAVKWFLLDDTDAVEGIVTWRNDLNGNATFAVTALYELHQYDFSSEDLRWYYGAGAHLALGSSSNASSTGIGIDGIIGLEYLVAGGPVSVSLDWKPAVGLIGGGGLIGDEGALTLRFQF